MLFWNGNGLAETEYNKWENAGRTRKVIAHNRLMDSLNIAIKSTSLQCIQSVSNLFLPRWIQAMKLAVETGSASLRKLRLYEQGILTHTPASLLKGLLDTERQRWFNGRQHSVPWNTCNCPFNHWLAFLSDYTEIFRIFFMCCFINLPNSLFKECLTET